MNLPTWITMTRIFLIPLVMTLALEQVPYGAQLAAGVFVIAALTDTLDGYAARARNEITKIGQLLDPIADKLLVSACLITLVEKGLVSAWLATLIVGREFAVSGLRLVVAAQGVVVPASVWGKLKTMSQIIGITAVFLAIPYGIWLLRLAAALTLVSGIDYYIKTQRYLR